MSSITSEWVSFLRRYGPISTNDNMYDESIHRAIKRKKIQPIIIESIYLNELYENFKQEEPKSIILTGTAGDGKTYNCREVWTHLGGSDDDWNKDNKIKELELNNGKNLIVIKDLSELNNIDRNILEKFVESTFDPKNVNVFLIAANDGQLVEAFKYIQNNEFSKKVKHCIEDLLVDDICEKEGYYFKLYNLSRVSTGLLFSKIVHEIVNHPGWDDCISCDLSNKMCPILENKNRLKGELDNKLLEIRIKNLLELCELNDLHLPIRQLFLLTANMILGHPDVKDKLMNCKDVANIIKNKKVYLGSIYRNVFGENLSERKKESTDVFVALSKFGIGYETSNRINEILIFGADDPELKVEYNDLILDDKYYGASENFQALQKGYLEGLITDNREEFLNLLHDQRQRLFFTINPEKEINLRLWELTNFQYAGEFLKEVYTVANQKEKVSFQITSRLVKGLNRIFTGMLTKNADQLFIATSGSHSQAKISRIYEDSISVPKKRGENISIKNNEKNKLVIEIKISSEILPIELPLQLVRYEFLSRVAEGALPGSFSKECYEDILGFKSKILEEIIKRRNLEEDEMDNENSLLFKIMQLEKGLFKSENIEVIYDA